MTSRCSFQWLHMLLFFYLLNSWTWGFWICSPSQLHNLGSIVNFVCPVNGVQVTCNVRKWTGFQLLTWPSCWRVLTSITVGPGPPRPESFPLQREQQRGGFRSVLGVRVRVSCFTSHRVLQEIMKGTIGFLLSLLAKFVTSLCGVAYWGHLIEFSCFSSDCWWFLSHK